MIKLVNRTRTKKMLNSVFFSFALVAALFSCKSVDFDKIGAENETDSFNSKNAKDEELSNEQLMQEFFVQEQLKQVDIEPTVIYVEKPVYYPESEKNKKTDKPNLKGKAAVKESTSSGTVSPADFKNGTMYYDFDSDFTYEIYCQPYRVTDLLLEPGEQVIEMPFLSEEKVWEIGAGVSREGNVDTQHFFLKPAYSGLQTAFIIITDKRVYHFMLKSYKDCYMSQVKFKYPRSMPFTLKTDAMESFASRVNSAVNDIIKVDPRYLSFDYKMKYSLFKKPYWLPSRVYDDGRRTYIVMNETVLHMGTPVLFNKNNERINYSTDKCLIIINELIEKVTLQLGKQKVVIQKKSYKEPKKEKIPTSKEEEIQPLQENEFLINENKSVRRNLSSPDLYQEAKHEKEKEKEEE